MITKTATKLTAEMRKGLGKGDFAIPELRKYPIHDESHARSALAMVSKYGTPAQKARVRSAVSRRYPGMGKTASLSDEIFNDFDDMLKRMDDEYLADIPPHLRGYGRRYLHGEIDESRWQEILDNDAIGSSPKLKPTNPSSFASRVKSKLPSIFNKKVGIGAGIGLVGAGGIYGLSRLYSNGKNEQGPQ